jgi:hypothetical protein
LYVDLLAGLLLSRGAGPADYRRLVSCWVRVLSPFWNSRFTDLIHRLDSLYFSGRGWTVLDPVDYARNLLSRSIAPAFRQAIEDLICTRQLDYGGPNGHPKDPFRFSGMLTNV